QKLWREVALVVAAPALLYLLASLVSYSSADPGWSRDGSVVGDIQNFGGPVGAWIADVMFLLFGWMAYSLPLIVGGVVWVALFGMDSDGDGEIDFGPALRLIGIVGALVAGTGLLHFWFGASIELPSRSSGGALGELVGHASHALIGLTGALLLLLALLLASVT
ncbi:MAG TPA: cell division protein FtsK, partial [Xanthomonadaceae bacterium]|nr:cell division protein FtsK [Xanthomonadaceae bacterium]